MIHHVDDTVPALDPIESPRAFKTPNPSQIHRAATRNLTGGEREIEEGKFLGSSPGGTAAEQSQNSQLLELPALRNPPTLVAVSKMQDLLSLVSFALVMSMQFDNCHYF